jgi:hypothetical protein
MISFTTRLLYTWGRSPQYPLNQSGWAPELLLMFWRRENLALVRK